MLNFRKSLKEQEDVLSRAERVITEELKNAPQGKLRCGRTRNGYKYYHKTDENSGWVYLPKSKAALAKALAQKEYYQKALPLIRKKMKIIRQLKGMYESDLLENIYDQLCPERKILVKPLFWPVNEIIRKWENVQYEPKDFAEGQKEFITLRGERVRSKSEKIIADELYVQGIPYLYEYPLTLKVNGRKVTFHPDFMVLNKRTGQRYFIEHLGKMDDMGYYNDSLQKIDVYEQNNYLIGRDILIFHESQARPINVKVIRQYIQEYLV